MRVSVNAKPANLCFDSFHKMFVRVMVIIINAKAMTT